MNTALLLLSLAAAQTGAVDVAPAQTQSRPAPVDAPSGPLLRVLVLDVQPGGLADDVAVAAGDLVAVALGEIDGLEVSSGADLKRAMALEGEKAALGCGDESCLGEIAGALGADLVIFGRGAKLGDVNVINLSLFDSSTSRTIERETIHFANASELLQKVPAAVSDLTTEALNERGVAVAASGERGAATAGPSTQANAADREAAHSGGATNKASDSTALVVDNTEEGSFADTLYWTGGTVLGISVGVIVSMVLIGWGAFAVADVSLRGLEQSYVEASSPTDATEVADAGFLVANSFALFALVWNALGVFPLVGTFAGLGILGAGAVWQLAVGEE